jgi:hypothetical protein
LEFGSDDTAPQSGKSQGEPARDAEYYYREATKYWLAADY